MRRSYPDEFFPLSDELEVLEMNLKRPFLACAGLAVIALAFAGKALSESDGAAPASERQEIVIHLSHFTDDLHRCFMALELATLLQGPEADVTLFLDLEGVRLAERRQLLDMTWGSSTTPLSAHYEKFIEQGGKVMLCPHCAKSARLGDMGLKRNAEIGTESAIAALFLQADKVLDY
jgi:predicted peroxiredoxin